MEPIFRVIFWILFVGMVMLQAYFTARIRMAGRGREPDRAVPPAKHGANGREGWWIRGVRGVRMLLMVVFLVYYGLNPAWMRVLSMPLSNGVRWIGVAWGCLSLLFYAWARSTLGKEWSSPLQTHQTQHLVTTGPYQWIRHPIYSALLNFLTSIALVAANWFLVGFLAISAADLAIRIPKEELMMVEQFGDEYEVYMARTGRLVPKWGCDRG